LRETWPFAYGCGERSFQSNVVARYAVDGLVRDDRLAVFQCWCHIDGFPLDWDLSTVTRTSG